jgi:hypothetical protein
LWSLGYRKQLVELSELLTKLGYRIDQLVGHEKPTKFATSTSRNAKTEETRSASQQALIT